MAVTRQGRSIQMTATSDAITGVIFPVGLNFQGTGRTAGGRAGDVNGLGDEHAGVAFGFEFFLAGFKGLGDPSA